MLAAARRLVFRSELQRSAGVENREHFRKAYGKRILATVSQELRAEFGEGFTLRSLYRSIQFFQLFSNEAIVSTLSTQLSWSHFMELLPLKDPLARDFYAEMCRIERWDVRTLRQKIGGMLFQRTALSKNTKAIISAEITNLREGRRTPDTVFRDPYFLDLLNALSLEAEEWTLSKNWKPILTDPDDEPLVQLAHESNARLVVSHNIRHLRPATNLGILIITPKELLLKIREKP